jgi:hypothetical protein
MPFHERWCAALGSVSRTYGEQLYRKTFIADTTVRGGFARGRAATFIARSVDSFRGAQTG